MKFIKIIKHWMIYLIKSIISKSNPKDIPFITNVCLTSMRYIFHTSKIIEIFLKKIKKNDKIFIN